MSTTRQQFDDVQFGDTLIEVSNLTKYFKSQTGLLAGVFGADDVEAVDDVSFRIRKGETLALVGESGCGKSTLARALLQLLRPTSGSVRYRDRELTELSNAELRPLRQNLQMIFQDPQSSLNPRMKVGQIVEEPMKAHDLPAEADVPDGLSKREARRERAKTLLEKVGLKRQYYNRYPHEFSGGQRQRLNLARALSTNPEFVMCDEPVSALDVSVQAQVLNTMRELQAEFGLTYLFISHDLSVVRYVADRVAVMYLGHIVELGDKDRIFDDPHHPYTEALLDAIPTPDPRSSDVRAPLEGDVPSPIDPPSGCRFRTRCPRLIQPSVEDAVDAGLDETASEHLLGEYGLDDEEWADVRRFMRAVDRQRFVLDFDRSIEEQRRSIEDRFFDGHVPGGDVGVVVDEAIDHLLEGEWDEAGDLLRNTFEETSICALERPRYTVEGADAGDRHFVGCHRYRE